VLPCAVVVSVDTVDFDRFRVAVRLVALWRGTRVVRIGVRDDEHPVAEGDPSPVPTRTPQFLKPKAAHSLSTACSTST
jgi:hypothetical protein